MNSNMNSNKIVMALLILFIMASITRIVTREIINSYFGSERKGPQKIESATNNGVKPDSYIVYYFHTDKRCPTCKTIEKMANETISANFKDEMATGKIKWRAINVEKNENKHFIDDFQLQFQSLVIVGYKNDGSQVSWENLSRVWELVHNKPAFDEYVTSEIRKFIGAKSR